MNKVDRYILGMYWGFFIAALLVLAVLFLATDALSLMVRSADVPLTSILKYYTYYLPEIIHKMIPVSCVVGTVLTISTLNKGSELIALFASGLSLFRISRFLFVSILFISLMDYGLSDQVVPAFTKRKNFIYYNDIIKNPGKYQTVKTDKIWYRSKNTIFNIKTLNADGHTAFGLTLYFFDENWRLMQLLTAETVKMNGENWTLMDGSVSVFEETSSFPLFDRFKEKKITMQEDAQDLSSTGQTSDLLTQSELRQYIGKNKDAGLDTTSFEVEYHTKFSFSLAGLVMSLLALPFSVGQARGGGMVKNVGFCLGLVITYWIFFSSTQAIGNHGVIPAILAAWIPNVVMSGIGTLFLLRLNK